MPASDISPDIQQLTDAELLSELTNMGVDVGPITDTTRKVYQRKLQTLLAGKPRLDASQEEEEEEEYSDEEVQPDPDVGWQHTMPAAEARRPPRPAEPEIIAPVQQSMYSSSLGRPSYRTAERVDRSDDVTDSAMTSIRQRTTYQQEIIQRTTDRNNTKQQKPKEAPTAKSRLSIFAQIAIFVVIAVIVFLVIQNMDPSVKKPWIGSDGKTKAEV